MPVIAGHAMVTALQQALGLERFEEITSIEIEARCDDVARIRIEMLGTTDMERRLRESAELLRNLGNIEVAERDGQRRILLQDEASDAMPPVLPPEDRMDV